MIDGYVDVLEYPEDVDTGEHKMLLGCTFNELDVQFKLGLRYYSYRARGRPGSILSLEIYQCTAGCWCWEFVIDLTCYHLCFVDSGWSSAELSG